MAIFESIPHEPPAHVDFSAGNQDGESSYSNNMKNLPPSPPALPVDVILPTRSGSPPPKLPPTNDEDENEEEVLDDKDGAADSSESSSADSSELVTPPRSIHGPTVQVVNDNQSSSAYLSLPPIPKSLSPPPGPPRRTKSTGILNYPSEYSRSRACSLPNGPDPDLFPSSSSSSTNVKFAPLPQLAPRKRKSNTPLGVAARGQLMAKRRQIMMQNRAEQGSQQNMFGDTVEITEETEAIAAAQARARARNGGGYGVDEDGEEIEDPFVALGRMFKGAWRKMKGKNDKETSANAQSLSVESRDSVEGINSKSAQPVIEQPILPTISTIESPVQSRTSLAQVQESTPLEGMVAPGSETWKTGI